MQAPQQILSLMKPDELDFVDLDDINLESCFPSPITKQIGCSFKEKPKRQVS